MILGLICLYEDHNQLQVHARGMASTAGYTRWGLSDEAMEETLLDQLSTVAVKFIYSGVKLRVLCSCMYSRAYAAVDDGFIYLLKATRPPPAWRRPSPCTCTILRWRGSRAGSSSPSRRSTGRSGRDGPG